jgi:hypothetical protein
VRLAGYVDDIITYLGRARTFVALLRFGLGTKGKVNLSTSYGLLVVAIRVAAERIGVDGGQNIFILTSKTGILPSRSLNFMRLSDPGIICQIGAWKVVTR